MSKFTKFRIYSDESVVHEDDFEERDNEEVLSPHYDDYDEVEVHDSVIEYLNDLFENPPPPKVDPEAFLIKSQKEGFYIKLRGYLISAVDAYAYGFKHNLLKDRYTCSEGVLTDYMLKSEPDTEVGEACPHQNPDTWACSKYHYTKESLGFCKSHSFLHRELRRGRCSIKCILKE
jgi:hypothetical protein